MAKKRKNVPTRQEILLAETAERLAEINETIARNYLAAAAAVGTLQELESSHVDAYLAKHARLPPSELGRLRSLSAAINGEFGRHMQVLVKSRMSPRALDALAEADVEVRLDALRLLRGGNAVGIEDISTLVEKHELMSRPEWRRWESSRASELESFSSAFSKMKIEALESKARAIVRELHDFDHHWSDGSFEEDAGLYDHCRRSLVSQALEALAEFTGTFGAGEDLIRHDADGVIYLAGAYFALEQISQGRFGYGQGLLLHRDLGVGDLWLADAVSQLVPFEEYGSAVPKSEGPLKVLELCAGSGGMALGLQSAGFEHVALYDNYKPSIQTLRHNQPHWPARHGDVQKLSIDVLAPYKDVDLLAAGLPCGPGENITKKPDLSPRMRQLVELLQPKAFIFENDAGSRKKPGLEKKRTEAVVALKAAGYVVTDFSLYTIEFGLPHLTTRDFLVGIRSDVIGVFEVPVFRTEPQEVTALKLAGATTENERYWIRKAAWPHYSGLGSRVVPSVVVHESARGVEGRSDEQKIYDSWAKQWRQDFRRTVFPDIPAKQDDRSDRGRGWRLCGFDRSEIVERPPQVGEVKDYGFRPRLTFSALAAAQGFPASWHFAARGAEKLPMIQSALPPVMARIVGLSVRSALTGEGFDLDKELEAVIIEDAKVGPQPAAPPRRRSLWAGRANLLPRNDLYHQAVRVLDGEALKDVEPNPKRRTPVKQMVDLVRKERARLAEISRRIEEEKAWMDSDVDSAPVFYAPMGSRFGPPDRS